MITLSHANPLPLTISLRKMNRIGSLRKMNRIGNLNSI
uniref:Uncharacterized protein n=1 Tax=Cucumis melo TaxID=3656 RepID=A0A9I9CBY6_CUCME